MQRYPILELQNQALAEITLDRLPVLGITFPFFESGEVTHWISPGVHQSQPGTLVVSNRRTLLLIGEMSKILLEIPHLANGLPAEVEAHSDGITILDSTGLQPIGTYHPDIVRLIVLKAQSQLKES